MLSFLTISVSRVIAPSLYSRSSPMNELVSSLNHAGHAGHALRRSARLLSVSSPTASIATYEQHSISEPPCPPRKRKHLLSQEARSDDYTEGRSSKKINKNAEPKQAPSIVDDEEFGGFVATKKTKPRKTRERQSNPVYSIPDVELKETTFKGRLGYACLNTILRNKKPATDSVFCSRTCRLDSLRRNGIEWVKDLGRKNVEDLLTIIKWNEDNNIRFFRISSDMFPFASHSVHGYSLEYCSSELGKAGDLAKKYGHRLTTHPGQYTQLGSPKPAVVESAIRELGYHTQMLDLMGLGGDSVMIIHGGGVYGDKPLTLNRLKESIQNLPQNVRSRLVLENDEICFNAEDLLPLCEELDIPFVFDYHHDKLFPSSVGPGKIIERANAIWKGRGIKPKQHLSEQRPGAVTIMERRAHADRCESLPEDLPDDMDLMIEAKDKEQAVLYLHRMYNLQPVNHASLRPATTNPSKQTNGRKSTKRARANAAKEAASQEAKETDDLSLSSFGGEDEEAYIGTSL